MVDNEFSPIENVLLGAWNFKGLKFTVLPGQWYYAWRPIPMLELASDPNVNNFEARPCDEPDPFPEWEWPNVDVKNITPLLTSLHEFISANSMQ
ncbi:MAG: hypothetical protein HDS65_01070 [Bacteroidales bacterium]|nr:hypothetical protein [Bacteroidales bacterium]